MEMSAQPQKFIGTHLGTWLVCGRNLLSFTNKRSAGIKQQLGKWKTLMPIKQKAAEYLFQIITDAGSYLFFKITFIDFCIHQ